MSYRIITASGGSNTATLILDAVVGLEVNEQVRVYGTGNNKIDGKHTIATITTATKTITYSSNSIGTVAPFNPANAGLVPLITWATSGDVEVFLGIATATANDADYLTMCVEASNEFCWRRRKSAGYVDSTAILPNPAVRQAAILYAAGLYRERGSVDSFQSYDSMNMPLPTMSMGRVLQLLGVGRPQVG
jgi:hypothetical protein